MAHPIRMNGSGRPSHSVGPGLPKPAPGYASRGPALPGGTDRDGARSPKAVDKYYPEWVAKNLQKSSLAESERLSAERLLEETRQLLSETRFIRRQDEREVEVRFRQRVGDIAFWKSELDGKLGDLRVCLSELDSQRVRVEQAVAACTEPLSVVEQCLANRAQRQAHDRCEDNVQKHLLYEMDTIKSAQTTLKQSLAMLIEEIRQIKKAKFCIEKDLVDKEVAMDIDQQTSAMRVSGLSSAKKSHSTRYSVDKAKKTVMPSDWQGYSESNLELACSQIKKCMELQSQVDGILAQTASALRSQKDFTDRAFRRRIDEVKLAKQVLQKQLSETLVKVAQMESNIQTLEDAILAKQGPLATCQQRIQQRKQRPNLELVADQVEAQLLREAQNLVESISKLEDCLAKSRSCHASLQKARLDMEHQIDVKANSIYIDEVKCLTLRQATQPMAY